MVHGFCRIDQNRLFQAEMFISLEPQKCGPSKLKNIANPQNTKKVLQNFPSTQKTNLFMCNS